MLPGAWQAQLVQRATGDLGVVSSSPLLGVKIIKKKKKRTSAHMRNTYCASIYMKCPEKANQGGRCQNSVCPGLEINLKWHVVVLE